MLELLLSPDLFDALASGASAPREAIHITPKRRHPHSRNEQWWHPDAQLAVVVLTNSEPDNTTAIVEALSAAVLPAGPAADAFAGDTSPLVGTYKGQRATWRWPSRLHCRRRD